MLNNRTRVLLNVAQAFAPCSPHEPVIDPPDDSLEGAYPFDKALQVLSQRSPLHSDQRGFMECRSIGKIEWWQERLFLPTGLLLRLFSLEALFLGFVIPACHWYRSRARLRSILYRRRVVHEWLLAEPSPPLGDGFAVEAEQLGCCLVDGGADRVVGRVLQSADLHIGQFVVYACERLDELGLPRVCRQPDALKLRRGPVDVRGTSSTACPTAGSAPACCSTDRFSVFGLVGRVRPNRDVGRPKGWLGRCTDSSVRELVVTESLRGEHPALLGH